MKNQIELLSKYNIGSLDHMTHIDNLDTILKHGLFAHNNPYKKKDISNLEVNARRSKIENIYNRNIHDYVPFYFNPRNAMMYKNKCENIVVLAFSKQILLMEQPIFTDKNAATSDVHFYNTIDDLKKINWNYVWSDSWNSKQNATEVKQSMMSEVLVYSHVSIKYLIGFYVKSKNVSDYLVEKYRIPANKIKINANMFFA